MRWGVAEFAAAEEMDRFRGYWWAPDGAALLVDPGRRHARAAVVDRRPRPPRPAAHRGRLPGRRHPERRRHARGSCGLDGARTEVGVGPRRPARTSPRRRGTTTARCSRCTRATSGASRCAAPTPRSGATEALLDRPRRRLGGAGAGHARPAGRRPRGRCAPTRDGRRRLVVGGTPVTPDDLHVRARRPRRRRPRRVHRQPDRRRHRHVGVALVRRRASSSSPPTTASTPPSSAATRSSCAARRSTTTRPVVLRRWADRRSRGARRHPARAPRTCTIRHVGERRLATALLLPHDVGPTTPGSRCCSTRTAGRTRSGSCRPRSRLPHLAVVRRPGLRRRGDRRPRHARAAARRGSAASTATSPARSSRTRSTGCSPLAAEDPRLDLVAGGDPRLELRRLPRRARRAAPPRRLPRRHRRRPGHRLAPLRHLLHGALPRPPRRRCRRLRRQLAAPRRPEARAPAAAPPRPGRRQRRRAPTPSSCRRAAPPAARPPHQVLPAHRASPTWPTRRTSPRTSLSSSSHFLRAQACLRRLDRGDDGEAACRRPASQAGHLHAWARKDLNLRRQCRLVYSQFPLATRARTQGSTTIAAGSVSRSCRASTWCPRSTSRRSATRWTRRPARWPPATTSRAPTPPSS